MPLQSLRSRMERLTPKCLTPMRWSFGSRPTAIIPRFITLLNALSSVFFTTPLLVVTAQPGGLQGGGAALTAFGQKVVQKYRKIETEATAAAKPQLHDLEASLRSSKRGAGKSRKTSIRAGTAR